MSPRSHSGTPMSPRSRVSTPRSRGGTPRSRTKQNGRGRRSSQAFLVNGQPAKRARKAKRTRPKNKRPPVKRRRSKPVKNKAKKRALTKGPDESSDKPIYGEPPPGRREKGVCWARRRQRWMVQYWCKAAKRQIFGGWFRNLEDANRRAVEMEICWWCKEEGPVKKTIEEKGAMLERTIKKTIGGKGTIGDLLDAIRTTC